MNVAVDGNVIGGASPLVYSSTGALTTPANGLVTLPAYDAAAGLATGAAPINLTLDLGRTTQYGDTFSMTSSTQNGFTTGRLIGIDIDSTGVVQARFTNGRSTAPRPGGDRQLRQSTGHAADGQHKLVRDHCLGPAAARTGRQVRATV